MEHATKADPLAAAAWVKDMQHLNSHLVSTAKQLQQIEPQHCAHNDLLLQATEWQQMLN